MGESQGERRPHFGERGGSEREHGEERMDSTVKKEQVPRRGGRASKERLPGRTKRKHERVSGRKSSPGIPAESWCHSKSVQT